MNPLNAEGRSGLALAYTGWERSEPLPLEPLEPAESSITLEPESAEPALDTRETEAQRILLLTRRPILVLIAALAR